MANNSNGMKKDSIRGPTTPGESKKERLRVAIRVRPIENAKLGPKILKVLNKQTIVLTELPNSSPYAYDKASTDLEHHFRTSNGNSNSNSNGIGHGNGNNGIVAAGASSLSSSCNSYPSSRRHQQHHQPLFNNFNLHNGSGHGAGGGGQHAFIKHSQYHYDNVFDEDSSQEDVYQATVAPLLGSLLEGIHVTVFAYGATGSGKTYSMIGTMDAPGIMIRAMEDVFVSVEKEGTHAEVFISYLELYNEQIHDLLQPSSPGVHLELLDDKDQVHISGLSQVQVASKDEVLTHLQKGNRVRIVEPTSANEASSRSHAILIVTVSQRKETEIVVGKLYLIDLAGSERASMTKNSGVRLREGAHINRSLLALGNCITALAAGKDAGRYVNYRDSKLTRLLKTALGGPSRTAMIAHVNPIPRQLEETRNTLIYAQRARSISNNVHAFTTSTVSLAAQAPLLLNNMAVMDNQSLNVIKDLQNQIQRLQMKLDESNSRIANAEGTAVSPELGMNLPPSPDIDNANATQGLRASPFGKSPAPSHKTIKTTSTNTDDAPSNFGYPKEFLSNPDRPNLSALKDKITGYFDEEFRLRNDLLKVDGTMFQLAVDCEILRLMVLDWEHLKVKKESDSEGSVSSSSDDLDWDSGKSEIFSIMSELKVVRKEQEKLLAKRASVEEELRLMRGKILDQEELATNYLPDAQREILSLLCKLQQEQMVKMSAEIETELRSRGKLLLRFIRQKTLGEAIIYTQRHFFNAITGRSTNSSILDHNLDRHTEKKSEHTAKVHEIHHNRRDRSRSQPVRLPSVKESNTNTGTAPGRWSKPHKDAESDEYAYGKKDNRLFHTPSPSPPYSKEFESDHRLPKLGNIESYKEPNYTNANANGNSNTLTGISIKYSELRKNGGDSSGKSSSSRQSDR